MTASKLFDWPLVKDVLGASYAKEENGEICIRWGGGPKHKSGLELTMLSALTGGTTAVEITFNTGSVWGIIDKTYYLRLPRYCFDAFERGVSEGYTITDCIRLRDFILLVRRGLQCVCDGPLQDCMEL